LIARTTALVVDAGCGLYSGIMSESPDTSAAVSKATAHDGHFELHMFWHRQPLRHSNKRDMTWFGP